MITNLREALLQENLPVLAVYGAGRVEFERRLTPEEGERYRQIVESLGGLALTRAEREILRCLSQGMPNKTIAMRRRCAISTVKNQLSKLYRALGVGNRVEAALVAVRNKHLFEGY